MQVHGEIWQASSPQPIESGNRVRVVAVEGLNIQVTRVRRFRGFLELKRRDSCSNSISFQSRGLFGLLLGRHRPLQLRFTSCGNMSAESSFAWGRLLPQPKGPGLIIVWWPIDRIVKLEVAGRDSGCAAAGHHHQRQRVGPGQCGGLLSRHGPLEGRGRGRELPLCHLPALPRPRSVRFSAKCPWTICSAGARP